MVYFNQITEKCQRNAKIEQLQMQVIEVQIIITNYSNWTWINEWILWEISKKDEKLNLFVLFFADTCCFLGLVSM